MRIVCWQTIRMKLQVLFSRKIKKISQIVSSATFAIGALKDNHAFWGSQVRLLQCITIQDTEETVYLLKV